MPVTVAERSEACTVFARSEAEIMGVCAFFCVCVQVETPCDELITRPRSPTKCLKSRKPKWNGKFHGGRPRPNLGL
jgi:hypothetical protein